MTNLLELTAVTQRFGGLVAVHNLDVRVEHGELMGLIGPNGAGKTTVFNLITGIYAPTAGRIVWLGNGKPEPLHGLKPHQINARGIARTFQNIRLYHNMTVLENILAAGHRARGYSIFPAFLHTRRFRQREAEQIELAFELLQPFGLDGRAFEFAGSLPYGDQRRLEIARALATGPRLLLLDEPAAGMNPAEADRLVELLRWVHRNFSLTVLLIEHQMRVVMNLCQRIQVMDFGKTIAVGTPADIRNNPRVIAAYLGEERTDV